MTPDREPRARAFLALHGVLLAVIAGLLGAFVAQRGNTLDAGGHWRSAKVGLERGVMGAVGAMVTRVPLHRNRLDLGAYFGHQQLTRVEERDVAALGFRFRLRAASYLDVLFSDSGTPGLYGVRLSADPGHPCLFFRVEPGGAFTTRTTLDLPTLGAVDRFATAELTFASGGVEIRVDGAGRATVAGGFGGIRTVGFRGSLPGALVDDVTLSFGDGTPTARDGFDNWSVVPPAFAVSFVGLGLLAFASFRGLAARGASRRNLHLGFATAGITMSAALVVLVLADFTRFSGHYPRNPYRVSDPAYANRSQDVDAWLAGLDAIEATPPDTFRILLVGSSQTWGAGARREGQALDRVLEARLASMGIRAEVIDAGISGWGAPQLLDRFESHWRALAPELVVVNLGYNDADPEAYGRALEGFAAVRDRNGPALLFVKEPVSPEGRPPASHAVMVQVGAAQSVPVLDMHGALRARYDEGHLWWDAVHLTPHGQTLFAERLAAEIERRFAPDPRGGARLGRERATE